MNVNLIYREQLFTYITVFPEVIVEVKNDKGFYYIIISVNEILKLKDGDRIRITTNSLETDYIYRN